MDIKKIRKELGISQQELAVILKVDQTTISLYELNKRDLSIKKIENYISLIDDYAKKNNLKFNINQFLTTNNVLLRDNSNKQLEEIMTQVGLNYSSLMGLLVEENTLHFKVGNILLCDKTLNKVITEGFFIIEIEQQLIPTFLYKENNKIISKNNNSTFEVNQHQVVAKIKAFITTP